MIALDGAFMGKRWAGILVLSGTLGFAQSSSESPAASLKQVMLDLIHPASNDLLLTIYRGGPQDDREWAAVRRDALTLAEGGNLLMLPGRALDQSNWMKDAKRLRDAGAAAYQAAQAKDGKALAAVAAQLDASCTACHKQYRPNVFPPEGGSK